MTNAQCDVQNAKVLHNYDLLLSSPNLNYSLLLITTDMQFCHQTVNITEVSNIRSHRAPAANAPGHTAASRLIVLPYAFDVPACTARRPHIHDDVRDP
jgi:hypothetical protein